MKEMRLEERETCKGGIREAPGKGRWRFREFIDREREENKMRHIYIRGILAVIWMAAAIISGIAGSMEMAALYVLLGGVFLYSAYSEWKK